MSVQNESSSAGDELSNRKDSNSTEERPSIQDDEEWKRDIKKDFKLSQLERQSTFMLISNMNTMYMMLIGLADLCFKNNE